MKKALDFQISEPKKFARPFSFSLHTVSRYVQSLDVLCLEDHGAERQAASLSTPATCHHLAVVVAVVVRLLSRVQLFATPWAAACQSSLSFCISQNLLKLTSIELVMSSWQN